MSKHFRGAHSAGADVRLTNDGFRSGSLAQKATICQLDNEEREEGVSGGRSCSWYIAASGFKLEPSRQLSPRNTVVCTRSNMSNPRT